MKLSTNLYNVLSSLFVVVHIFSLFSIVAAAAVPIQSKASHELAQRGLSPGYADSPVKRSFVGGQQKRDLKEADELIARFKSEEL